MSLCSNEKYMILEYSSMSDFIFSVNDYQIRKFLLKGKVLCEQTCNYIAE